MKNAVFVVAGFAAFIAVGAALAGSAPQTVTVKQGCHGRQYALVPEAECGCHGQQMLAPAYSDDGCHGGRLTFRERRTARSAARSNYNATLAQFREAGRRGANLQAVPVSAAPTMKMVPVQEDVCACGCPVSKCKCPK